MSYPGDCLKYVNPYSRDRVNFFIKNIINDELRIFNIEFTNIDIYRFNEQIKDLNVKTITLSYCYITGDSMVGMFRNCKCNVINLRTSQCEYGISMREAFQNCVNLTAVKGLELFTRKSGVINMAYMFDSCRSLTKLNFLDHLEVDNVQSFAYMFHNCTSITNLNRIDLWITCSVKDMTGMFENCTSLVTLSTIYEWDVHGVRSMKNMFKSCYRLSDIRDISAWKPKKLTNVSGMFMNCYSLIDAYVFNDVSTIEDMSYMFYDCISLKYVDRMDKWDLSNVKYLTATFYGCESLDNIDHLSEWKLEKVKTVEKMFGRCVKLIDADTIVNGWNINKKASKDGLFFKCINMTGVEGDDNGKVDLENAGKCEYDEIDLDFEHSESE